MIKSPAHWSLRWILSTMLATFMNITLISGLNSTIILFASCIHNVYLFMDSIKSWKDYKEKTFLSNKVWNTKNILLEENYLKKNKKLTLYWLNTKNILLEEIFYFFKKKLTLYWLKSARPSSLGKLSLASRDITK